MKGRGGRERIKLLLEYMKGRERGREGKRGRGREREITRHHDSGGRDKRRDFTSFLSGLSDI